MAFWQKMNAYLCKEECKTMLSKEFMKLIKELKNVNSKKEIVFIGEVQTKTMKC